MKGFWISTLLVLVLTAAVPPGMVRAAHSAGVAICTSAHYDPGSVRCSQQDDAITQQDYAGAMVVVRARSASGFTSNTMLWFVSKLYVPGSYTNLGMMQETVALGNERQSLSLATIFSYAGVFPAFDGTTYRIDVDAGGRILGWTMFTLGGYAPPPPPAPVPQPQAPVPTRAPDACAGAGTPENTVVHFYLAISERRYAAAYQCLAPALRAKASVAAYIRGYATTAASRLLIADRTAAGTVWVDLQGVNTDPTHTPAITDDLFQGVWSVTADGHLTAPDIALIQHASPAIPTLALPVVHQADLLAFDKQTVLRHLRVRFASDPGTRVDFYLTHAGTVEHLWIFRKGELVFAQTTTGLRSETFSGNQMTVRSTSGTTTWEWTPYGFDVAGGRPVAGIAPFVGWWVAHSGGLLVSATGMLVLQERTYHWCTVHATGPCDSFKGNLIIDGIQVTAHIGSVANGGAQATILTSTVPGVVAKTLELQLLPHHRLNILGPPGALKGFHLCNQRFYTTPAHSTWWDCGA